MGILDWAKDNWKDLAKIGGAAAKYYIDAKDQQRRMNIEEGAYNKYLEDVANASQEAQAAIDVNLTPMTVSNVPTSKADVSSFTAVAARGGLMNLPTRHRKRYYGGTGQEDIEIMEPESLGDFELQKEEGVNIGEQVFHDTGDDRTNALNVWKSGSIDQEIYEMNFELFFNSRDWEDHISRGTVQGDTQMASAPGIPGIEGLRHGGRPGYQFGIGPQQGMMPQGLMPQGMMPQQGLRPGYQEGIGPNQGSPSIMANATTDMEVEDASGIPVALEAEIKEIAAGSESGENFPATDSDFLALEILSDKHKIDLEVVIQIAKETNFTTPEQSKGELYAQYMAKGGRPGYADSNAEEFQITQSVEPPEGYYDISARDKLNPNEMLSEREDFWNEKFTPERGEHVQKFDKQRQEVYELAEAIMGGPEKISFTEAIKKAEEILLADSDWIIKEGKQKRIKYPFFHEQEESGTNRYDYLDEKAKGGRIRKAPGGIMNLGGMEKDYRTTGGFVPIGGREKADDVPARLSKNEFVMTADAVRAAGGGSINKGAQRMYDTMKHLEASPQSKRMTA
jgi:hypothetical protein